MFTLTLPITLAIIKALIVEAGGQVFAIPLSSVLEILQATDGPGGDRRDARGDRHPGRNRPAPPAYAGVQSARGRSGADAFYVILVGLAERRLGHRRGRPRDQQEIVIKPLGKRLAEIARHRRRHRAGDQRGVVLVLDVESLIEGALKKDSSQEPSRQQIAGFREQFAELKGASLRYP